MNFLTVCVESRHHLVESCTAYFRIATVDALLSVTPILPLPPTNDMGQVTIIFSIL